MATNTDPLWWLLSPISVYNYEYRPTITTADNSYVTINPVPITTIFTPNQPQFPPEFPVFDPLEGKYQDGIAEIMAAEDEVWMQMSRGGERVGPKEKVDDIKEDSEPMDIKPPSRRIEMDD